MKKVKKDEKKREKMKDEATFAGVVGGIVGAAGVGLAILGGPVTALVGGAMIGAGISGTTNAVQQANSDKTKFDYGGFTSELLIGGASGSATAGIGSAGGAIASKLGASSVAATIGVGSVAGSAGGVTS